jgi:hypothetical protein
MGINSNSVLNALVLPVRHDLQTIKKMKIDEYMITQLYRGGKSRSTNFIGHFFLIKFRIHPSDIEIREHQISHIERDCRVHIFKALFRKSFTIHPSAMARAQNAPQILERFFSHKKFT